MTGAAPDPETLRDAFDALHETPVADRPAAIEALRRRDPDLADRVARMLVALDAAPHFLVAPLEIDSDALTGALDRPATSIASADTVMIDPGDPSAHDAAGLSPPPDLVPGHRLVAPLASGGSGIVFVAEQLKPRRQVAIKLLRHGVPHPADRRRFEFEAELLARMSHPGIAAVHAAGLLPEAHGGSPWISMELVEGARRIDEWCRERALDDAKRVELVISVADAVQHAHRNGAIHRDLKPGNVLVDADGRPRVIDFGIAIASGEAVGGSDRRPAPEDETGAGTMTGTWVGTPGYMSPEQLTLGRREVDARADVFGLGVILYELLTGSLPHDLADKPLHEMMRVVVETDPVPPREHRPSLDADLEQVVLKAIRRERDQRYGSIPEFAADLRRWSRKEPVLARPPTATYRARKFVQRHRVPVTASVLATAALLGTSIAATALWQRSERTLAELRRTEAAEREAVARATRTAERLASLQQELAAIGGTTTWATGSLGRVADGVVRTARDTIADTSNRDARRTIIGNAITTLDRLEREVGDDPALRTELASGYSRLGSAQGLGWNAAAADVEPGIPAYERAVAILERLVHEAPTDAARRDRLAAARMSLGEAFRKVGRSEEAFEQGSLAVADAERAFEDDPTLEHGSRLVRALWVLGDSVIGFAGDRGGLTVSRRAAELADGLRAAFGDRPDTLELVSWTALRHGLWLNRDPEAIAEVIEIFDRGIDAGIIWIARDARVDAGTAGVLANALNGLAAVEAGRGPHEAAAFAVGVAARASRALDVRTAGDPPIDADAATRIAAVRGEMFAAATRLFAEAGDAERATIFASRTLGEAASDAASMITAADAVHRLAPTAERIQVEGALAHAALARTADLDPAIGGPGPDLLATLAELLRDRGERERAARAARIGLAAVAAGRTARGPVPESPESLEARLRSLAGSDPAS